MLGQRRLLPKCCDQALLAAATLCFSSSTTDRFQFEWLMLDRRPVSGVRGLMPARRRGRVIQPVEAATLAGFSLVLDQRRDVRRRRPRPEGGGPFEIHGGAKQSEVLANAEVPL